MSHIRVWCEYDFSGGFGGNNDEEICVVEDNLSAKEVEWLVKQYLMENAGLEDEEDLDGMYGWEYYSPVNL